MNGRVSAFFRIVLLCALLCAAMLPLRAPAQEQAYSRTIEIEGIGPIRYYAQNDPLWARMVYEPRGAQSARTMLSSGCGPTAAAIIRGYGVERALFGSDYPMWVPGEEIDRLLALPLTDGEKEKILWDNHLALLGDKI